MPSHGVAVQNAPFCQSPSRNRPLEAADVRIDALEARICLLGVHAQRAKQLRFRAMGPAAGEAMLDRAEAAGGGGQEVAEPAALKA
jgi:hypothetical protein